MVNEKVCVIDEKRRSAGAAGLNKHCTWYKLKKVKTGKTQQVKRWSHPATENQLSPDLPITSTLQRFTR